MASGFRLPQYASEEDHQLASNSYFGFNGGDSIIGWETEVGVQVVNFEGRMDRFWGDPDLDEPTWLELDVQCYDPNIPLEDPRKGIEGTIYGSAHEPYGKLKAYVIKRKHLYRRERGDDLVDTLPQDLENVLFGGDGDVGALSEKLAKLSVDQDLSENSAHETKPHSEGEHKGESGGAGVTELDGGQGEEEGEEESEQEGEQEGEEDHEGDHEGDGEEEGEGDVLIITRIDATNGGDRDHYYGKGLGEALIWGLFQSVASDYTSVRYCVVGAPQRTDQMSDMQYEQNVEEHNELFEDSNGLDFHQLDFHELIGTSCYYKEGLELRKIDG